MLNFEDIHLEWSLDFWCLGVYETVSNFESVFHLCYQWWGMLVRICLVALMVDQGRWRICFQYGLFVSLLVGGVPQLPSVTAILIAVGRHCVYYVQLFINMFFICSPSFKIGVTLKANMFTQILHRLQLIYHTDDNESIIQLNLLPGTP